MQCLMPTMLYTDVYGSVTTVFILAPQDPGMGYTHPEEVSQRVRGTEKPKHFCTHKDKFCHYVAGHGTTEVISVWRVVCAKSYIAMYQGKCISQLIGCKSLLLASYSRLCHCFILTNFSKIQILIYKRTTPPYCHG